MDDAGARPRLRWHADCRAVEGTRPLARPDRPQARLAATERQRRPRSHRAFRGLTGGRVETTRDIDAEHRRVQEGELLRDVRSKNTVDAGAEHRVDRQGHVTVLAALELHVDTRTGRRCALPAYQLVETLGLGQHHCIHRAAPARKVSGRHQAVTTVVATPSHNPHTGRPPAEQEPRQAGDLEAGHLHQQLDADAELRSGRVERGDIVGSEVAVLPTLGRRCHCLRYRTGSMSDVPAPVAPRRLSARGWVIFVVAAIAVVVAAFVGIRGLTQSPIISTVEGVTTISGTWEPYSCTPSVCEGYVSAGARSVFIVFPSGCAAPVRASTITVEGRKDTTLGNNAYRTTGCG